MAVASGFIEELRVMKGEQRSATIAFEGDRHQRFPLRRRVPRPAEHQPLVRYHLAIDAGDLEIFAALVIEAEPETAAGPGIDLGPHRLRPDIGRAKPVDYFFRVGPRDVDFFRARIEPALDGEAGPRGEIGCA